MELVLIYVVLDQGSVCRSSLRHGCCREASKIFSQQSPHEKGNRYELEAQPVQYDAAKMQMAANVPQVLGANPPLDHGVLVDDK